jgi:hypothetical protein
LDWNALLLLLLAALGYLYRSEWERRQAVERQLSDRKYEVYVTLMNTYFDVMKAARTNTPLDQEDLIDRMNTLAKELILYGSDEVYKAYLLWTETGRDGNVSIKQFGKVVAAIRKDMNPKTRVTYEEVLRLFINDFEDAKGKGLLEGIPLAAVEGTNTGNRLP